MDDATEELYLQKIEEMVHDDDLIVTTEVLCRKLDITITDSRHLIAKYLTDHRNVKPTELGVHYIVLGELAEGCKFSVLLVAESDLKDKLSLFKSGYSKEIYSIQKAKSSDVNAFNLLNPEPREKALLGSVVSKNCIVRKKLVSKPIAIESHKRKPESVKPEKSAVPVEKKVKLDENIIEKKASPKKTKITNKPVQNGKGKGIASFFAKMAEKPKMPEKKPPVQEEPKTLLQNEVKDKRETSSKETTISKEVKPVSKLIDTDDESDDVEIIEQSKKEAVKRTTKKVTPTSSKKISKKRGRKEGDTPETSQKRRKRVIEVSDSDEDVFGKASDGEDTDLLDSSQDDAPQERIAKPPKIDPFAPKNKQKKFVDKSYVDDEGFMVTKKEWVAISGSEDEEEPQKEQEAPNVPLLKPSTNKSDDKVAKTTKKQLDEKKEPQVTAKGKGKNAKKAANQPSILSFFSKK